MKKNWKYIVYETTNIINNKIYVGLHKTKDPNIFDGYIGNGVISTQPYTYQYAKTAFQCAVKKYGPKNFVRKTLAIFDTLEEASALEAEIVNEKFLQRNDVYNMILGGIGGYYITHRVEVHQYDLNGNYLNTYLSYADAGLNLNCTYEAISAAVKFKIKCKESFWSTEKVQKLNINAYNKGLNHSISIFVYDIKGNYLGGYKTQAQAVKNLHTSYEKIQECYKTGVLFKNTYYISTIKKDNYADAKTEYIKTRPVFLFDNNGKQIRKFNTQLEAESEYPDSNITKSIKLKTPDKLGYIWGLEDIEFYNKPKLNKKRPVLKMDLSGNIIKEYPSATAAEKENGTSIWKVLNGTNKTHKQHIYKYKE